MNKMLLDFDQIVNSLPIGKLTNTDANPFWYVRAGENKFAARYQHEAGKKRDTFYDGNNGDRWIVRAVNLEFKRMIVENKTQYGMKLVYWD